MANFNQWIGIGHVTRDPEVKSMGNSKLASFRIACNISYCIIDLKILPQ